MAFDIRDYIWDIFELSNVQNIHNVLLSYEFFMTNVELGINRYKGLDIDYVDLRNRWNSLSERSKEYQKDVFISLINLNYKHICEAWNNHNKDDFTKFVHKDITIYHYDELHDRIEFEYKKKVKHKKRKKKKKNKIKKF